MQDIKYTYGKEEVKLKYWLCLSPKKVGKQKPWPLFENLLYTHIQRYLDRLIYLKLKWDECLNNNHFLLLQPCMFEEQGQPSV